MNDTDDHAGSGDEGGSGGFLNEDWAAAVVGLAILAFALFGLIPDALLW